MDRYFLEQREQTTQVRRVVTQWRSDLNVLDKNIKAITNYKVRTSWRQPPRRKPSSGVHKLMLQLLCVTMVGSFAWAARSSPECGGLPEREGGRRRPRGLHSIAQHLLQARNRQAQTYAQIKRLVLCVQEPHTHTHTHTHTKRYTELQEEAQVYRTKIAGAYDQFPRKASYSLFAVWIHAGVAGSGHYWAYIRAGKRKRPAAAAPAPAAAAVGRR
jgi:hypothetical protein